MPDMSQVRPVDLLLPLVQGAPPWLVFSILAGLTSAATFFLVAGRGFRSLPTYLILGVGVAPLCQILAQNLPPMSPPLVVGEVQLALVAVGTWLFLGIARALRL
jgi:hypothetical protein